eukprot:557763-Prymnesium_polylepis.1
MPATAARGAPRALRRRPSTASSLVSDRGPRTVPWAPRRRAGWMAPYTGDAQAIPATALQVRQPGGRAACEGSSRIQARALRYRCSAAPCGGPRESNSHRHRIRARASPQSPRAHAPICLDGVPNAPPLNLAPATESLCG